jgi:hypothetical protein
MIVLMFLKVSGIGCQVSERSGAEQSFTGGV